MKKIIFTALIGFAMLGFTGCTTGSDASAPTTKCQAGKTKGAKTCDSKKVAKKCDSSKKCASSGKCAK